MRTRSLALVVVALFLIVSLPPTVAGEEDEELLECVAVVVDDVAVGEVCPPWEALVNGDFELCDGCDADTGDLPRNWSYVPYAWASRDGASWTQRVAHRGASALDLSCGADHATAVISDKMAVDPGAELAWTVHVRGVTDGAASATYGLITVELFDAHGSPLGGAGGYGSYTDGTWQRYDANLTVPDGAGFVALQLGCGSDLGATVVTFDDATVRRA